MKQKITYVIYAIVIVYGFTAQNAKAQVPPWENQVVGPNSFNQPDYSSGTWLTIESVGIGDFKNATLFPLSALHVNTNLMYGITPNYAHLGEVFRTDCPIDDALSTYWRMLRGGVEYGTIYNLSVGQDYTNTGTGQGLHFYLQASGRNDDGALGDLRFNTGNTGTNAFNGFSNPRMRILGTNGYVGIGDYDVFLAQSMLHQHSSNDGIPNTYHQFTNNNTGAGSDASGFRLGIELDAGRGMSDAHFRHFQNDGRFVFSSIDQNSIMQTRINIQRQTILGNEVTRVKIIEDELNFPNNLYLNSPPMALLHLGHDWVYNAGGHRTWMDIGTYNNAQSDQLYLGMKNNAFDGQLWSGQMNAIIGWGDNIQGPEGADDMQVIFTAPQVPQNGHAADINGLEVMRFVPRARVGIGNFSPPANGNGSGIRPHRRLEIYDEHVLVTHSTFGTHLPDAPQLRLTYTPDANVVNGIWTDFQTTNLGDLYIHPSAQTGGGAPVFRNVGINTSTPDNTLEIDAEAVNDHNYTGGGGGISGLRFNDMANTSTAATTNPVKKF